ncbi:MAG TPA: glutamate--cysteine ligase [Acidimicrobiales bacterium]|jgi:carboxylate-amine ligase|nr:glutamate--cysteine ligase [Acidimicrobiales bacterium]
MKVPSVGVEEEFLLVDAETGRPAPRVEQVVAGADAEKELHRAQIEINTEPCSTLAELADRLTGQRASVAAAARDEGTSVVASGTYPGPIGEAGRLLTEKDRYRAVAGTNIVLAREQLICGCHVHIEVTDDEDRVRVVDRIRRHLPSLLALSANSPFWEGWDTGFASFRSEQWVRWPSAGVTARFGSYDRYRDVVDKLVAGGVMIDEGMVYWDARLSRTFPTVEVRVADVCLSVDDAVTVAGLVRALVLDALTSTDPDPDLRPEFLRGANWLAARHGIGGRLMDPADGSTTAAADHFGQLLDRLAPVLAMAGDEERVGAGVRRILSGGTGADRQRACSDGGRDLAAVIDLATLPAPP